MARSVMPKPRSASCVRSTCAPNNALDITSGASYHVLTIRDALLGMLLSAGLTLSSGRDAAGHSTYYMDNLRKKQLPTNSGALDGGMQRRRISRIVHDDRGNASVDWLDAPSNYKRQVLELADEPGALSIEK